MISKRLITKMTKGMYAFGILFLLTGLLLSAVSFPAMAQEQPPDGPAGAGAIWTTNEGCDNPAAQDDNLYEYGQIVHIRGSNFDPLTALTWEITGQPGSATPGLIANGVGTTDATGYFCLAAHTVAPPEDGTYTVDVYIGNTKKNDNYRVNGIAAAPLLSLAKLATPTTYANVGETITYTYTLTNDGNVPLDAPYTVDDDKATVVCPVTPNPLPVGESVVCTAAYTITQADLDAGSVTNEAIAHAAYAGAAVDSNTDFETVTANQNPVLSLLKTATPPTYNGVGDVISYDYLLTNNGNVTLVAPFSVTDNKTTVDCSSAPPTLAPGASFTCTATYTITQDDMDAGLVTNTATGYGYFNGGQIASNPDDETVTTEQGPALMIIKTADDLFYDHVGQVLTYTYELINMGNVSLNPPFTVIDDIAGPADCNPQPAILIPGDSLFCTASYVVTQADMDAGSVVNIAVGEGHFGATEVPAGQDTAVVHAQVEGPALGLVKTVDPDTYANVGDVLTYTYQLTNLGDVTLTGFTVTDDKTTVDCSAAATTLLPGESTTCTATYTITQADIDAGFVTNVATGHGQDPTGAPVDSNEDDATATTALAPALTLDKQVTPATYSNVGDVLNYSYVLTNSGNVTLYAPFSVLDDKVTVDCSGAPATLLPGESTTCYASHIVTQADIDAGSITNIATAYAEDPTGAEVTSNDDTETVTVQVQGPSLSLVKLADPQTYSLVGDVINYTYDVTNNGNVTLDGPFTVTDDKTTVDCSSAPSTLAPEASFTCTATYTITLADLVAGSVTNVATAQGFFEGAPVISNDDTETVEAVLIAPVVLVTAEDQPSCVAIEGEACITFTVNITGLTVGQIEFYADLLGYLTGDDPEVFLQDGEYQVTVCGLWPGIADPAVGVQMELGGYAEWHVDGAMEEMGSASAFVFYDPATMREICFPLEDLAFLDPFCYRVDGEWTMAVQLGNPNDTPVDIVWTLNGGPGQALTVPALDKAWLANLELGTTHTVAAVWGTDGFAELKARMTLADCELPPPPPPPGPTPEPVPPAEAPVAEAGVLIPVTGVDLGAALGLGFFKSLMIYLGLGFLGMAFIVHGLRSKFK